MYVLKHRTFAITDHVKSGIQKRNINVPANKGFPDKIATKVKYFYQYIFFQFKAQKRVKYGKIAVCMNRRDKLLCF